MGDQVRVPLSDAPDYCTAPIVAADDDPGNADLGSNGGDGVGVGFEGVVTEVGGEPLVSVSIE